ncbi:hypothetical protein EZV62_017862 [Acer yangbiense]|uniref:EXS domain-containing protein n=1 Tax=Acer yangbiense TaxID=1000413 RepID=A0A5C7HI73_9ROSI|nr:hypothetical protein EZV62_017862 [Acer yangbiense]
MGGLRRVRFRGRTTLGSTTGGGVLCKDGLCPSGSSDPPGATHATSAVSVPISSRNASKSYMKTVDNSYLGSSDEITKLMERVEVTFVKHFLNVNRTKGMNVLRPKTKRERHRITFSTGFFAGCTFALLIALVTIICAHGLFDRDKDQVRKLYMDNLFPIYSLFGFLVLHMIMYGINIFYWRKYRVNYSFSTGGSIAVLALLTVIGNLDMEVNPKTKNYNGFTESFPQAMNLDKNNLGWKISAWIISVTAAVGGTYWDLVYDWGLLNRKSKNRWLRDKLLVPEKKNIFHCHCLEHFAEIFRIFRWLQTVYIC